ncbi:MAG TPA: hypothetical protein HPP87_01110 [Planctomycetes bacterium]|nr:hypothetical protein [Planctomycetota bacterium]
MHIVFGYDRATEKKKDNASDYNNVKKDLIVFKSLPGFMRLKIPDYIGKE